MNIAIQIKPESTGFEAQTKAGNQVIRTIHAKFDCERLHHLILKSGSKTVIAAYFLVDLSAPHQFGGKKVFGTQTEN